MQRRCGHCGAMGHMSELSVFQPETAVNLYYHRDEQEVSTLGRIQCTWNKCGRCICICHWCCWCWCCRCPWICGYESKCACAKSIVQQPICVFSFGDESTDDWHGGQFCRRSSEVEADVEEELSFSCVYSLLLDTYVSTCTHSNGQEILGCFGKFSSVSWRSWQWCLENYDLRAKRRTWSRSRLDTPHFQNV